MKKIVLVGLAASLPALAADPATVPEIRRVPGGAPAPATRSEGKAPAAVKLRGPAAESKVNEFKFREDKHRAGASGEIKGAPYGEIKERRAGGYPSAGELKAPAEHQQIKEGALKLRGDAAIPESAPTIQREAPVRY